MEFRRVMLRFGATLQSLRSLARSKNFLAWNITPKVHMCQHLQQQSTIMNPRWVQNYTEESQIGTTTKVWARSATGAYRRTIQRLVLLKRIVALVVRLSGRLD